MYQNRSERHLTGFCINPVVRYFVNVAVKAELVDVSQKVTWYNWSTKQNKTKQNKQVIFDIDSSPQDLFKMTLTEQDFEIDT